MALYDHRWAFDTSLIIAHLVYFRAFEIALRSFMALYDHVRAFDPSLMIAHLVYFRALEESTQNDIQASERTHPELRRELPNQIYSAP